MEAIKSASQFFRGPAWWVAWPVSVVFAVAGGIQEAKSWNLGSIWMWLSFGSLSPVPRPSSPTLLADFADAFTGCLGSQPLIRTLLPGHGRRLKGQRPEGRREGLWVVVFAFVLAGDGSGFDALGSLQGLSLQIPQFLPALFV